MSNGLAGQLSQAAAESMSFSTGKLCVAAPSLGNFGAACVVLTIRPGEERGEVH